MVVYEDVNGALVKLDEPRIAEENHQIIVSTLNKPLLVNWLKKEEFPEPFFEDIASFEQTPSFEDFSEGTVLILKYLKLEKEEFMEFYEENVALINIGNKLAVVCKDEMTAFDIEMKFDKRMRGKRAGVYFELYTFLDILTDQQIQTLDNANAILETLEEDILSESVERRETLKNLYYARRSLNRLSHIFGNESVALSRFFTSITASVKKKFRFEFLDLKEHKQSLVAECRSLQDKTVSLLNLQLGLTDNKANEAMQKLAGISLIFIPLTFFTSIFSMNFKNMPELEMEHGYHAVMILSLIIGVATYMWLKKKKYL
ncbi:MAG: CorA family divalent cation transporter [Campylobacterales bacterium]|nr:CorA family divalent cation transporter [Campylobacterales bacterium]